MSNESQALSSAKQLVGPASLTVSSDRGALLCTSPLGSCLGVAVYDPTTQIGGLMHCMLPTSNLDPQRATLHPAMFLDTGLAALLGAMQKLNANTATLRFSIAVAARILDECAELDIGKINCDYCSKLLDELGFEIFARSVGDRTNCSMELALETGDVRLRYAGQSGSKTLCRR